jgi:hypothetical protein
MHHAKFTIAKLLLFENIISKLTRGEQVCIITTNALSEHQPLLSSFKT